MYFVDEFLCFNRILKPKGKSNIYICNVLHKKKLITTAPILQFTMKNYFTAIALFLTYLVSAQTATVNYSRSTAAITNPERGFYRHMEVHSSSYSGLDQNSLTSLRLNNNTTLVLRLFYLENFISTPISSAYLNSMQSDFNKIRAAGMKCIVRFAYSDNTNGALDASKAQILAHILQIKPLLIANEDVIYVMQAGFIGSWGEWYYTNYFGMSPTPTDYANRKEVVDAILSALPGSRMIQLRTPTLKQKTFLTTTALAQSQAFNGTNIARTGHHNDCFLASSTDFGTYNNVSTEYPYLEQETKYVPMGGETCAVNAPRSQCSTALYEMQKFHWSYLNFDYNPSVISGFQSDGCFPDIQNRLGYRLELVSGTYPIAATAGTAMNLNITILNTGFSSLINPRTAYLVLRNSNNNQEYTIALATNPRLWSAGAQQTITESVMLPSNILTGSYHLYLKLPDSNATLSTRPEYSVQLANLNTWENATGYNNLQHTITVNSSLDVATNNVIDMKMYPVPTNSELIIEFGTVNDFNITLYNSIGQMVKTYPKNDSNRMILNTQSLSNGMYFVQFQNKDKNVTKKIIIKH